MEFLREGVAIGQSVEFNKGQKLLTAHILTVGIGFRSVLLDNIVDIGTYVLLTVLGEVQGEEVFFGFYGFENFHLVLLF